MHKILLIVLVFIICRLEAKAQSLQLFQLDTADDWVSSFYYSDAVTLSGDKIIHSYLNNKRYEESINVYGDATIKTYNTDRILLEQEQSSADSLYITKTILKENGAKIILGNAYHHLALYDTDTMLHLNEWGASKSFILQVDASGNTINYGEFFPISDIAFDKENDALYFTEKYAYDSARVYTYNLSDGNRSVIATVNNARTLSRIIKTRDYIYIAGATIESSVDINDHHETTDFPYGTFVIQLNNDGAFNWIRIIEDVTTPNIGIATAQDQGIFMCADLSISVRIGDDSLAGPNWGGDFFLTSIDTSGNFLWATEAPNNKLCGYSIGRGFSMDSDDDFNIFLAGYSRGLLQWDDSTVIGRDSNINVPTVLIYSKTGSVINHIIASAGEESSFFSIDVTGNGDFVVSGSMSNSLTFNEMTRTVTDDGLHPYFLYYKNEPASLPELRKSNSGLHIYPNPVAGNGILNFEKEKAGIVTLDIFNITGQKVQELKIKEQKGQVRLQNLSPGTYYIRSDGMLALKLSIR